MFESPKVGISGKFKVEVLRDGKVINSLPEQKNIVLNQYLASTTDSWSVGGFIQVGTGGTVPAAGDTSLVTYLANTSSPSGWTQSTGSLTGSTYTDSASKIYTFTLGAVVGNISELGLASATTTGLQTRALFLDQAGAATTITVTSADQLIITYTVTKEYDMTPVSGSVTVGGVAVAYTLSPIVDKGLPDISPSELDVVYPIYYVFGYGEVGVYTVDATTYALSAPASGSAVGIQFGNQSAITRTLSGSTATVTHTLNLTISEGNVPGNQYKQMMAQIAYYGNLRQLFLVNFPGPNYITKTADDIMTIAFKETIVQV
tara:strand:- start:1210 stop:2160 length:951 start_codon:yes stop_codon:yes gene_type:complete